jgi:hypothetical protein
MVLVEFMILSHWDVMLSGSEHFEGMDFLHLAGLLFILQEDPAVHRCSVTYQKTGTLDYMNKKTSELAKYN